MNEEAAKALRERFPDEQIGKLPRAGIQLDYVGHAAVTDRLLAVDPEWTWEPAALDELGAPLIIDRGKDAVMWIRLTVCGVTRLGVGIVAASAFELEKQLISDALRNAAMRFGVALDLWTKQDLHDIAHPESSPSGPLPPAGGTATVGDYPTWSVRDLATECSVRGLQATGSKTALARLLARDDERRTQGPSGDSAGGTPDEPGSEGSAGSAELSDPAQSGEPTE